MSDDDTNAVRTIAEMVRLTASGVLGFYSHYEATEIFAVRDDDPAPLNIFSIFVAEDREVLEVSDPVLLGERIKLKLLPGWTFGIKQYICPISELNHAFEGLGNANIWNPSGKQLHIGRLISAPTQFVPPDSTTQAPWNKVLKNNFWSGSHVIEWVDTAKTVLQPFFDNPPLLQELSVAIQKSVPIGLASLSDRLGNVVVQLPVTALIGTFAKNRVTGDAIVSVKWHPKATPRPLRASCELQFDNIITGYVSANIEGSEISLPMAAGQGMQRGILWDDQHQVILAATGSTGFITTIAWNMHISDPEPRVFTIKDKSGDEKQIRIGLSNTVANVVKAPVPDRGEDWTRRRIYREEAAELAAARRFVQYKPMPGQQDAEHEKALNDIRLLLAQHGKYGAWLWDPYLSAGDVLCTLFYCPHKDSSLRALTEGILGSFAEDQRAIFHSANSNFRNLCLEYRMKVGPAGWKFHDRFLIFPNAEGGALAWSLGTSVNSLGRQHHILQQVDDGQLVMDAFNELWNQLDQPQHLVWKTP